MKKWIWISLALLVLMAILASNFFYRDKNAFTQEKARRGSIVEAVYGIGTVIPEKTYQVRLGVVGTLEQLYVREGDYVKTNTPLLRINSQVFKAPFDGTITALPFNLGENVFANIPLLTMTDLKNRYLSVSLEQQGALRIRKGQQAQISFDSIRNQKFSGKVRSIFPNGDQFMVDLDTEQLPDEILPAMTADVAIEISKKENAVLIPLRAVSQGKIILLKGGRRQKVDATIGIIDGEWAELITPDLSPEDEILVSRREN